MPQDLLVSVKLIKEMGRYPTPTNRDENNIKKGAWTPEEDQQLITYIQTHGHGCWRSLPKHAGLKRCGKSCRLRWTNYLRPDIKRGKFSQEEENTILHYHSIIGNKWSAIAARLPGRTDNEIKNYWNTHLKKKLIHKGIDPMTHQPRSDLFSCLPQLASLAYINQILEHNQLAQNLQYLNLLLHNNTNPIPQLQEENIDFSNELPSLLNQESVSQPLHDVSIMNLHTTNDHKVLGLDNSQSRFTSVNFSSSSWMSSIPPLIDATNNAGSLESESTISYGGSGGDVGVSSYNWPEFLFEDSNVLDQNLPEIC